MKFVFYNNGWWEVQEELDRIVNVYGGWNYYKPKPEEIIEKNNWSELDWTHLLKPDEITGWISPSGEFFGCKPRDHELIADLVLNSFERELEVKGFVKIYFDSYLGEYGWYSKDLKLTYAQKQVLENKGIFVDDDILTFY